MSRVPQQDADLDIDLAALFAAIWRKKFRILFWAIVVAGLTYLALSFVDPSYQAETRLHIRETESEFVRSDRNQSAPQQQIDRESVGSQVEVLKSSDLLLKVINKNRLNTYEEFSGDGFSLAGAFDKVLVSLGLLPDLSQPALGEPERQAVSGTSQGKTLMVLREKVDVYQIENSRIVAIRVSSNDPVLAAAIANSIAAEYLASQESDALTTTRKAAEFLGPEITKLENELRQAEAQVAAYRANSDILLTDNNSALATQQLSELSSELSRTRANRSAAEATALSMREALKRGASLETVPDVLSSPLIQRLRERQVQLQGEIADLSTTLLDGHPRIRSLRSQLNGLDTQILTEAEKILVGLNNEVATSRQREQQLTKELEELKRESARVGEEQIELRALERDAAAKRELLQRFQAQYREALSRSGDDGYQPPKASLVEKALVPPEPYFPKKGAFSAAAFAGTLLFGVLGVLMSELFSGRAMSSRSSNRVDRDLDLHMEQAIQRSETASGQHGHSVPSMTVATGKNVDGKAEIVAVAEHVISSCVERAVVVSPEGDEAALTSVLLAREIADQNVRVLLLDMTRSGAASRPMLENKKQPGITDLLAGEVSFSNVIHGDHFSNCDVIPSGTASVAKAMRAIERLPIILDALTSAYDIVVIECGAIDAGGLGRLTTAGAEVIMSVLNPHDPAVYETGQDLYHSGYGGYLTVSWDGHTPAPGRDAA